MPEKPLEQGHVYSKETEDLLVEQLEKSSIEAENELINTMKRSKEVNELIAKLKEGHDVDERLRALYESLPQKKK